jgi:TolB protein
MTAQRDLDELLRNHFESHADRAVIEGQLGAIVNRTAAIRQRPGWLARLRSTSMTTTAAVDRREMPRGWLALAVVGLIILGIALGLVALGSRPAPPPFNGMIGFGRFDATQEDTVIHLINPDGTHERVLRPEIHEAVFFSPDGSQVGFTDGYINADGTGFTAAPFSQGTLNVPCWDWSPDGQWCLAEGWDDTDASRDGLYLVAARNRTSPRQLTHRRDIPGVFSPDGRLVAFRPDMGEERPGPLMIVGTDGTGERRVGDLLVGGELSFTPDGKHVLVTSNRRLYRVDLSSGEATPITIEGEPGADIFGGIYSPDGTRILFRRPMGAQQDLFTMAVDGTDVVRLTNSPEDEWFLDWGTHPWDE